MGFFSLPNLCTPTAGAADPSDGTQSRSNAAFSPLSTSHNKMSAGRAPIFLLIFAQSSVVTWWQSEKLIFGIPRAARNRNYRWERLACDAEVDIGTTMTDLQPGVKLKPS
jgi:hypothetical protein